MNPSIYCLLKSSFYSFISDSNERLRGGGLSQKPFSLNNWTCQIVCFCLWLAADVLIDPAVAHVLGQTNEAHCKHFGVSLYQNIFCGVLCALGWGGVGWGVPELISHLLWFVAATRTVYCPCGWIGAVRRRKEQCWAKHQRYSQNVLRLPHTRTLFHLSINTPSKCRFRLKTSTEGNLCTGLSTRSSETTLK